MQKNIDMVGQEYKLANKEAKTLRRSFKNRENIKTPRVMESSYSWEVEVTQYKEHYFKILNAQKTWSLPGSGLL